MTKRGSVLFSMFLSVAIALTGCAVSPTATPVSTRMPSPVPSATLEPSPDPSATAEPTSAPTVTPEPSPTPLPPQPPRLLRRSPERGEEHRTDAPLAFYFDQDMDAPSVERAFRIEPSVEGRLSWDDGRTMRFTPPDEGFQRDATYQVTIDRSAKSVQELALALPVEFRFRTVGFLEVTDAFPVADSADVSTATMIRAIFNRPVVPLVAIKDQAGLPEPLEFTPPVQGKGSWISTSIYSFAPSDRLSPGTRYTVGVRSGLRDVTGGLLEKDFFWSFTTEIPAVVIVRPHHQAQHISPDAVIEITFNQPMQPQPTQARFTLTREKGHVPVRGTFSWNKTLMTYTPGRPLDMGATYHARLEEGSPAATGEATIAKPYDWAFQVAARPDVIAMSPTDGESAVGLGEGLRITFSSPISRATFLQGLTITPEAKAYAYWRESDTVVRVSTFLKPSTVYTVTLTRDILGRYGHPLRKSKTVRFRTRPYDPMIHLNVPGPVGTYNSYATPTVYVQHRNVSSVSLALYALSPEEFVALNSQAGQRTSREYEGRPESLVRRWSKPALCPLNAIRSISTTLTQSDGASLAPGLYYLEVTAPAVKYPQRHVLVISPMNLTLKSTQTETLIWATDLRDGLPLPSARISIYDASARLIASTETDGNGVATATIAEQDPWAPLILLAETADGIGAVLRHWSNGISPWDFQLRSEFVAQEYRAHLYTDRGIYRPGQTVRFKAILRSDNDARYSLPPVNSEIELTAVDSQGREFWQATARINDMGTIDGEFELGEDASLGLYHIQAMHEAFPFTVDFQVAEYRKPEFQVKVSLDQADYVQGDTIRATAEATYFFGGPVARAAVHWRVMRKPFFFDRWQGKGYYSFHDYDYGEYQPYVGPHGEFLTEGDGQTDGEGRFDFALPADIAERKQSQVYTIEVSVVDLDNQEVSARSAAIVHKGTFYVGLSAMRYVGIANQEQSVQAITVDTQGLTHTRQALQVIFYQHEWYSVKERAEDGYYYWINKVRDTPVATRTVKTDDAGRAVASFVPTKGGTYKVLAKGLDERGNEVRSATYLWISGRRFINWGQRNNDRIDLIADKKSYRPGDTAQILIPSPYAGATTALLTIERGTILEYKLLQLESNSEQFSLPILPEYAPNVYVSVVMVKGIGEDSPLPSFKVGYVMLPVSTEQKELRISITPDRSTHYQPRESVTYDLEILDYQGRGLGAELSLQLVDLAVESLVAAEVPDIVQAFYRERGLGIATATTLALSVDRHNLEYRPEGKGGGGGGPGEGIVRQYFPDTAFWAPTVRTDESGHARVTVDLPDTLTTWRLTAQGVTEQTVVGKAHADIVSTLDVMIRPVTPRFMVVGDEPMLGAVVHNNTDGERQATVSLDARGVEVSDEELTLTIPAKSRQVIEWPAVVGPVEEASLQFSVVAGTYSDSVALHLPVYQPSSPETVGTSGEVEDRVVELVRLPKDADTSLGELTIQLEPSLAASMAEGLEYLRSFPYHCVEQTVSRFLPNVVTYRALREFGIESPELETQLPQQVGVALQRLYALQNLDGGWGWWPEDDSSPTLTAYVILGLTEAQRSYFAVDQGVVDRGIAYLYQWLDKKIVDSRWHRDRRATVLYVLAEAGEGDLGRTVALYDQRANMDLFAKAYLAMALQLLDPNETSRPSVLLNDLVDSAILSATGAHWEEQYRTRWAMNTDTRTTAIVLRALVRLQPENSLLPNVVRWLMTARSSGRWETTQENVWSILALTDYMVATGELTADYAYSLWVNGAKEAGGTVTQETVDRAIRVVVAASELYPGEDSAVVAERTVGPGQEGTGKLYYSASLRYFLPAQKMPALNRGIIVDRQYYFPDDPDTPLDQASVNDIFVVKLTLIAPSDLYYLVLEDALPAGCEAIDTSLKTSRSLAQPTDLKRTDGDNESSPRFQWERYRYWPTHTELRDEKVVLFASHLPRGTYEYTYSARCTTPGLFMVMPTTAYEMYSADVFGRSAGATFAVQPADW